MEKPSPNTRLSMLATIAHALGMQVGPGVSTAKILNAKRGKAPAGRRWVSSSIYTPGGEYCNVQGTPVRNPKIAAQINAMYEKWWIAKQARLTA